MEGLLKSLDEPDENIDGLWIEEPGLGRRFKNEVKKALLRIAEYPPAWATEKEKIRKCPLHKFPYKLIYSIESDHILLLQ